MSRRPPEIPLERFYLHTPTDLLSAVKRAAHTEGVSVSKWITRALKEAIDATVKGG